MPKQVNVDSFDGFMNAVKENEGRVIFALFSGAAGADGKSWCPDCVSGSVQSAS